MYVHVHVIIKGPLFVRIPTQLNFAQTLNCYIRNFFSFLGLLRDLHVYVDDEAY